RWRKWLMVLPALTLDHSLASLGFCGQVAMARLAEFARPVADPVSLRIAQLRRTLARHGILEMEWQRPDFRPRVIPGRGTVFRAIRTRRESGSDRAVLVELRREGVNVLELADLPLAIFLDVFHLIIACVELEYGVGKAVQNGRQDAHPPFRGLPVWRNGDHVHSGKLHERPAERTRLIRDFAVRAITREIPFEAFLAAVN